MNKPYQHHLYAVMINMESHVLRCTHTLKKHCISNMVHQQLVLYMHKCIRTTASLLSVYMQLTKQSMVLFLLYFVFESTL